MRGISEKTLQQKLESLLSYQEDYELLKELIAECKELNPWLLIDENTPKDRDIWLYYETYYPCVGSWCCLSGAFQPKVDPEDYDERPSHYQELPDDPETGD